MKINRLRIILFCTLSCLILMGFLLWRSERDTTLKNNFVRLFPPHFLTDWNVIDMGATSLRILGITSKNIYMGTPTTPLHFKEIDYATGVMKDLQLNLAPQERNIAWRGLKIYIDSVGVYLVEGITPSILYSDKKSLHPVRQVIDSTRFTTCLPISPSHYILKIYDPQLQQNILVKETLNPVRLQQAPNVLKKQVDGVFCTEGDLHYDQKTNRLIYVYRYRNEYLYMDTDLRILQHGKTIDTVSKAQIKVTEIESQGKKQYILAAPPLIINKKSRVYKNLLFVHSNRPSKNEDLQDFKERFVIDVYALASNQYLYSFYIPGYREQRVRDFIVYDKTLVVLYDRHIIAFSMNP